MIDSTVVRAHQHAACAREEQEAEGFGRSRGGWTTKVHAKVDSFGLPLDFIVTPGQVADITQAPALIGRSSFLLADKGYDCDAFRQNLLHHGITPVIPFRSNRKIQPDYDKTIYKERNLIERCFNKLKHFRRIATRYDKTAIMFKTTLVIAAIILWIRL